MCVADVSQASLPSRFSMPIDVSISSDLALHCKIQFNQQMTLAPPSVRQAPRLWAVWGAGALCSLLTLIHHCPQKPLAERPGFDRAVAALPAYATSGTSFVVWPPAQSAALDALPAAAATA